MGLSTFKGAYREDVSSSATWVITHNLNTETPVVDVWVGGDRQLPLTVIATSVNIVTITFTAATAGKVIVA